MIFNLIPGLRFICSLDRTAEASSPSGEAAVSKTPLITQLHEWLIAEPGYRRAHFHYNPSWSDQVQCTLASDSLDGGLSREVSMRAANATLAFQGCCIELNRIMGIPE